MNGVWTTTNYLATSRCMPQDDAVLIEENADHGFVVTVSGAELGDMFDDFLIERCGRETTVRFGRDSMAFYLGKSLSRTEVEQIVEAFRLGVPHRS